MAGGKTVLTQLVDIVREREADLAAWEAEMDSLGSPAIEYMKGEPA